MPSTIAAGTTAGTAIAIAGDTTGNLAFQTNGTTTAMTIDTSQNVGIGTTSPSGLGGRVLQIEAASNFPELVLNRTGTGVRKWGAYISSDSSFNIRDYTNSATWLAIDTSGNLLFNSGYGSAATAYGCRAWVNFNGTGTVAIRASGNVTSITDNGVGLYTVNLATSMPDINYSVVAVASPIYAGGSSFVNLYSNSSTTEVAPTTSAFTFRCGYSSSGVAEDLKYICVSVFR